MHGYRLTAGAIDAQVKQLRATGAAKVWLETARGARGPPQPHHGCPLDHCQVMADDNLSYEIFSCGSLPGRVADGRGTDV